MAEEPMTVTIYRLPTAGRRGYRGEYPDSIRHFEWPKASDQEKIAEILGIEGPCAHIETMKGDRYIIPYRKLKSLHKKKKSLFGQFIEAVTVEQVSNETYAQILEAIK